VMAAMLNFGGVAFYAVFASGELQPWAEPAEEESVDYPKKEESQVETTAWNEVSR